MHQENTTRSAQLLQSVVTNVPVVLFAYDAAGNFILSEGKGLEALGLKPGEVVGRSVFDVFADSAQIVDESKRALAGEMVDSHTQIGDLVFEVRYTPLLDDEGKVQSVTGVAHDITQVSQLRETLRLQERAIESSDMGISIADMRKPDQPLIFVNQAFEHMTGYAASEVVGYNCRFLQGDDRDQEALDTLRAALKNGENCTVELRNYRKDGSMFWNQLKVSPIRDAAGHVTHFVGFQLDVTRRKEYEQEVQRQNAALLEANIALDISRRDAEEATRLKSDFLATMSHELRTPLNAIIGYADILQSGMAGEINEEQRGYHQRILANADNLLSMINNLLDISKIEAGRMELVHKSFVLRDWLNSVVVAVEGLAKDKGLSFSHDIDERLPQEMMGDPGRLQQIAVNLLSNAIKFTEKGSVNLSIRQYHPGTWQIVVSDTGIGIPSHMQETIFDEFRQVDGTSQRAYGGTGLGLAIVRKLALRMGGNVRLQSVVNKGSVFTVILPIENKDEASAQKESQGALEHSNGNK